MLSPADYADHAEEYSKAVLFRRERQVGEVCWFVVLGVDILGGVCDYQRNLHETLVSSLRID